MSDELLSELSAEGVLHLTFNRPARKNAFNRPAWSRLKEEIDQAQSNPAVACVVLSGAGKDFSSGMDLSDFGGDGSTEEHPFYQAQQSVINFDKPMIGAAKGIAVGGGATLLFHCDIIYVGQSLKMRLPFVNLGLVPEFAASFGMCILAGFTCNAVLAIIVPCEKSTEFRGFLSHRSGIVSLLGRSVIGCNFDLTSGSFSSSRSNIVSHWI